MSNPENNDQIYLKPISKELVKQIVEFSHQEDVNLDLYSTTQYFIRRETWTTAIRRDFFGIEPTVVDFSQLWQREQIIKGTLVARSAEEKAKAGRFRHYFRESLNFSQGYTPVYPEVDFINVTAPGVSKGAALEALASHLGVALTQVIAIGDAHNDISLLSRVGLAIAMGDATDELKAVADYVTLDVEHSGVAAAVNKFLL